MGCCKDCKFWENMGKNWNVCNRSSWVSPNDPIGDTSLAVYASAHDDSGLDAGIKTGALFGCVGFCNKRKSGLGA